MDKVKPYLHHIIILLTSVYFCSCFPKQKQVDFDKTTMEVSLCETGAISRIKIYGREKGSAEQMNKITEIVSLNKGTQRVSLIHYNVGYDSVIALNRLMPNYEYQINIPNLDNQTEILFYTNSLGNVDSVVNPFCCK